MRTILSSREALIFYLSFFVLSYGVEFMIGETLQFAKKPRFAWVLLLANFVTHPAIFFLMREYSLLVQIMAVLAETGIFFGFYYYHYKLRKLSKTRKNKYVKTLLFDYSLVTSLAMNVGSYVVIFILRWLIKI